MEKCKRCGQEMPDEILAKIAADDAECEKRTALYAEAIKKWNTLYPFSISRIFFYSISQAFILIGPGILFEEINPKLIGFGLIVGVAGFIMSFIILFRINKSTAHNAKKKMETEYPELFSILESRLFSFGERAIPFLW